tara:strand:- start:692 stop:871 length:180 start_codon:yes stop_codon:yes gene_type:complete
VIGQIIKAILEWITGMFRHEIKADDTAQDSSDVPAHIRERFYGRLRKHKGAIRKLPGKK